MKKFKTVKLDKRHTGHQIFSHYIEPSSFLRTSIHVHHTRDERVKSFIQMRNWFNTTFGFGVERDIALEYLSQDDVEWAWHTENEALRIYLNEKAYSFYTLRWS